MIQFFRRIRQRLLSENKITRYLIYAIGEIVLVVIGILIALQINNNNEIKKQRVKELHYLQNIKTDLKLTIAEINKFIVKRNTQINMASQVIEHFDGKPINDVNLFNKNIVSIYSWKRFFQINNTFKELTNSGNLALISNDSIKNGLLNIDALNKQIKYSEDHFRYDAEIALYEPSYSILDINEMAKNFVYQMTNGAQGELVHLKKEGFQKMLTDKKQKNGFAFAILEFNNINIQFQEMKNISLGIVNLIEKETNRHD